MRTADVVNATAAGSWSFCNDTAAPIAMAAAITQEVMKTHMFLSPPKSDEINMDPRVLLSKRSNVA